MGTPTPDNEPTSGCALCFGSGRILGDVQPKYITVRFSGVRPGLSFSEFTVLPTGPYRLQHVQSCLYRLVVPDNFAVRVDWAVTRTRVSFVEAFVSEVTWNSLPGDL